MIKLPPECKCNKFIGWSGDDHYGELISVNGDGTERIIKSFTSAKVPPDGRPRVIEGNLYRVGETDTSPWPYVIRTVKTIPDGFTECVSKNA